MSKLILLVDADRDALSIMKAYLEHHGYRVADSSSGQDALELVRDRRPDLIIGPFPMDVPGHSPFTRAARAELGYEGPILSVTSRALPAEIEAAEAASSAVLLKPVPPATVLGAVRRLLGDD